MTERVEKPRYTEEEILQSSIYDLANQIARIQLIKLLQSGSVKFPIDPLEIEELPPVVIAERIIDQDKGEKLTFEVTPNATFSLEPVGYPLGENNGLLAYAEVKNDEFYEMVARHDKQREESGYYEVQKHTSEQNELDRRLDIERSDYLQKNKLSIMQNLKTDLQTALVRISQG